MLGSFNYLLSTQKELTILNRPRQKSSFSGFSLSVFERNLYISQTRE